MRNTLAVLVLLALPLAAGGVFAEEASPTPPNPPEAEINPGSFMGPPPTPARIYNAIVDHLRLAPEQQGRLLMVFLEFAKTHTALTGQMRSGAIGIAQMMLQDNPDRGKVEQSAREIQRMVGEEMQAGVKAAFAAKDVLTAEQWKSLQTLLPRLISESVGAGGMPGGEHHGGCPCPWCRGMGGPGPHGHAPGSPREGP
jgi:Spy/CpxP family protein refolding chaperone